MACVGKGTFHPDTKTGAQASIGIDGKTCSVMTYAETAGAHTECLQCFQTDEPHKCKQTLFVGAKLVFQEPEELMEFAQGLRELARDWRHQRDEAPK